jgi:hypothetical protein
MQTRRRIRFSTLIWIFLRRVAVAGRLYPTSFYHEDRRSFGRSGTVHDPSRNRVTLVWPKGYRPTFQIDQELALQDKEKFIFLIVFVPMEFSLHQAQANDTVIHLAKGLVIPRLLAGSNEGWHVNQLKEAEPAIKFDGVADLFFHVAPLLTTEP